MELKILSGNNFAESSSKAEEDDFINEELEKFMVQDNNKSKEKVLIKDAARDACTEIYEKKKQPDAFKA
ncbi:MAG: hypothetical protein ACK55Z_26300 [bacterium]